MTNKLHSTLTAPFLWYDEFNYSAPYCSKLHTHPAWQLTLALEGEFYFKYQRQTVRIAANEWILFSPDLAHIAGSDCARSSAIQLFFRHFPQEWLPEFAHRFNFLRNFQLTGCMAPDKCANLRSAFAELIDCKSEAPDSLKHLLPLQFIVEALSSKLARIPPRKGLPLEFLKVLHFMEENLSAQLSVSDLAHVVALSESRFSAVFRQFTGLSPMEYLNEMRLGHAQNLLLAGESQKNAAQKSGFSSASYFCRKFKQYSGKTPGEFCKEYKVLQ